jgi:hypothetical protein
MKVYMHIVTTAYVPVDHRQNSFTSFNQNIYSRLLSPVTESKRKYSINEFLVRQKMMT